MAARPLNAPPTPPQAAAPRVDLDAVRAVILPLVVAHGLELVDVEWTGASHGKVLRVTIDRDLPALSPNADTADTAAVANDPMVGGITLEACVRVSRDVSTALDIEELIPQAYHLEVSSPGLDRPLRTARDFARQVGRMAKVKLRRPASDGQHVLRGTIVAVEGEHVHMQVDGNAHVVALDDVREAKLVFELGAQPKREPRKSRPSKKRKSKHR